MIPKLVVEPYNLAIIFSGAEAWYNDETNTIVAETLEPRWLAILHELGHWIIGYFPVPSDKLKYHIFLLYYCDSLCMNIMGTGAILLKSSQKY